METKTALVTGAGRGIGKAIAWRSLRKAIRSSSITMAARKLRTKSSPCVRKRA